MKFRTPKPKNVFPLKFNLPGRRPESSEEIVRRRSSCRSRFHDEPEGFTFGKVKTHVVDGTHPLFHAGKKCRVAPGRICSTRRLLTAADPPRRPRPSLRRQSEGRCSGAHAAPPAMPTSFGPAEVAGTLKCTFRPAAKSAGTASRAMAGSTSSERRFLFAFCRRQRTACSETAAARKLCRRRHVPGISSSRSSLRSTRGGSLEQSIVYGCSGFGEQRPYVGLLGTRPAYITTTSSAVSATTPRSCVIRSTAVPCVSSICRNSSKMRACIVRQSAVVGSSAIMSFGLQEIAMAIIARCFMPPKVHEGLIRRDDPARSSEPRVATG